MIEKHLSRRKLEVQAVQAQNLANELFCQFLRSKNLSASVSRKLRQFLDVHSFSYMKQLV